MKSDSALPGRLKSQIFGVYFFLLLMLALFPPFYLSVSGSTALVLGIPLPIFYWVAIAVLAGLGLWALYVAELKAGEIPEEGDAQ
ncbi:hypothetical protein P0D91_07245 [Pseudomonas sp. CBSPBW29]|uniref:hypothetical protein n=1 Tax=unclassified Pseudomonas TaxID=196821 RepID=UPI0021AD2EBB|nr:MULTISPECIES: hypothetical protein [unclassified Pseudomonas]WEL44050.1 hypothetical protein P0D91_07245 [Pseudomonas sp. CBSPBW29]WEL65121.1 hypothetical protein P0D93_01350 [Pseudomonas sp. CBSPGW29]WEL68592.1 hypothetical protein P0D94_20695 [Pseudomonas sp. CBSPCGW29]WEL75607.1 hypothetical protein P0D92_26755 [Pseudomonas sp. CBSPAW29]WEL80151.1 hypothetical protein P0D95_19050 [Pseudomonas sp. CBSPCAW29]WEL88668.1 hypothetical protein P0D90_01300 [Pseudomonas sp. CBSPCBW29]